MAREVAAEPLSKDLYATLLRTKLQRHPFAPDILPDARLLDRLNEGRQLTLALISAAAGYGRSTLTSRWAATCNCPSAWVSLNESENNLRMFLAYVVATIRSSFPKMNLWSEIHLDTDQLPRPSVLAYHLLNTSQLFRLRRWLSRLPGDVTVNNPLLLVILRL